MPLTKKGPEKLVSRQRQNFFTLQPMNSWISFPQEMVEAECQQGQYKTNLCTVFSQTLKKEGRDVPFPYSIAYEGTETNGLQKVAELV